LEPAALGTRSTITDQKALKVLLEIYPQVVVVVALDCTPLQPLHTEQLEVPEVEEVAHLHLQVFRVLLEVL
jgi:hypothetical protein